MQVSERNGSLVNKIFDRIPDKAINTRNLNLGEINYKDMMGDGNILCSKEVSDLYDGLNRQYRYMINMKDENKDNLRYVASKIREAFGRLGCPDETIADMLVEYLYGRKKRYKQLLWFCYGQYVVEHLERNLGAPTTREIQCIDCGEWIETRAKDNRTCRCSACQHEENKRIKREYWHSRKR